VASKNSLHMVASRNISNKLYKCVADEGQHFEGNCVYGLLSITGFKVQLLFWNFLPPCICVFPYVSHTFVTQLG